MSTLLKISKNSSSLIAGFRNLLDLNRLNSKQILTNTFSTTSNNFTLIKSSLLFNNSNSSCIIVSKRTNYIFNINNKLVKYRRATRPKKSNDNSVWLNYEQAQFAENLGVTKSWNSWNTSNLLDGKRQAENSRDDILIRKFLYGTFHDLFASEIIIKRKFNTIDVGFLIKLPRNFSSKIYFLVGYSEELLSSLLKCTVKIQIQSVYSRNDLVFRTW